MASGCQLKSKVLISTSACISQLALFGLIVHLNKSIYDISVAFSTIYLGPPVFCHWVPNSYINGVEDASGCQLKSKVLISSISSWISQLVLFGLIVHLNKSIYAISVAFSTIYLGPFVFCH